MLGIIHADLILVHYERTLGRSVLKLHSPLLFRNWNSLRKYDGAYHSMTEYNRGTKYSIFKIAMRAKLFIVMDSLLVRAYSAYYSSG